MNGASVGNGHSGGPPQGWQAAQPQQRGLEEPTAPSNDSWLGEWAPVGPADSPGEADGHESTLAPDAGRFAKADRLRGALGGPTRRRAILSWRGIAALTGALVVIACFAPALLSSQRSDPYPVPPALSPVPPMGVHTTTDTVATCDESTLRSVIGSAGPGDTVTFGCTGTITLAARITIRKDATIDGSGQAVTISGEGFRILGASLTVNHLTIANSNPRGYSFENYGTVTATNSTFSLNSASGGGIENFGTVTVTSSTFSGPGANGPGVENFGMLTVADSTFNLHSAGWPDIENFGRLSVTNNRYSGGIQDFGCVSHLPVCS